VTLRRYFPTQRANILTRSSEAAYDTNRDRNEVAVVEGQRSAAQGQTSVLEGWIGGWASFAAIMLMIAGGLHLTFGLVAVLDDTWVGWTHRAHAFLSVSAWGWVQIAVGALVFVSGVGVILGSGVARVIGVVFAGFSLIDGFFIIPLYRWWAMIIIGVDVLVIWALTVHWQEASPGVDPPI